MQPRGTLLTTTGVQTATMCYQIRSVMRCQNVIDGNKRCGRISAGTLVGNVDGPDRCIWWGIYTAFDQPMRRPCEHCPQYRVYYTERAGNTKCAPCYKELRKARVTCDGRERKGGDREGPGQGAIVGEKGVGGSTAFTAVNAA